MITPRVEIDLEKITQNARCLTGRLGPRGISVTGVTKAVCGHPGVAEAMLTGGVVGLADSRIRSVMRMRQAGIRCPISMIRAPMVQEVADVIRYCDTSHNSEKSTILNLGATARQEGKTHQVILTVEMGDMRDGILPEDLNDLASLVVATPGLALKGVAANFACLSNVAPTAKDMAKFSRLADKVEGECGPYVAVASGGSSANLAWALGKEPTGRVNNLRLGEAILLGIDPVSGQPIDGLHTDAFALFAEVIEANLKPSSMPMRPSAPTFGKPFLISNGDQRHRAVLAVGRQDTDATGLFLPSGFGFAGASSDHTVVDTGKTSVSVGSEMKFGMNYAALIRAMSASDVEKVVHHGLPIKRTSTDTRPQPFLRLI